MKTNTVSIPESIAPTLTGLVSGLKESIGYDHNRLILYGYYSRRVYSEDQDIDIMVLISDSNRRKHNDLAAELPLKYLLKHEKLISLIFNNKKYFKQWKDSMDLFRYVDKEGILLV